MGKIINARVLNYLEANYLLDDSQSGFRKLKSTDDQVAYYPGISMMPSKRKKKYLPLPSTYQRHSTTCERKDYFSN